MPRALAVCIGVLDVATSGTRFPPTLARARVASVGVDVPALAAPRPLA